MKMHLYNIDTCLPYCSVRNIFYGFLYRMSGFIASVDRSKVNCEKCIERIKNEKQK